MDNPCATRCWTCLARGGSRLSKALPCVCSSFFAAYSRLSLTLVGMTLANKVSARKSRGSLACRTPSRYLTTLWPRGQCGSASAGGTDPRRRGCAAGSGFREASPGAPGSRQSYRPMRHRMPAARRLPQRRAPRCARKHRSSEPQGGNDTIIHQLVNGL